MFGLELMAEMSAHTDSVTDSIIEDYKKKISKLEKENERYSCNGCRSIWKTEAEEL